MISKLGLHLFFFSLCCYCQTIPDDPYASFTLEDYINQAIQVAYEDSKQAVEDRYQHYLQGF